MTLRLEILISCMGQPDLSIAWRTNISSDAVIVNQCDREAYDEGLIGDHKVRMYSCTERGLSRSRNKAVKESTADICLLCDDDERLADDYTAKILEAYEAYPDADVIAFKVEYPMKKWWESARRIRRLDALRICSWQITFKRESIAKGPIRFDERFGAGSGCPPFEEIIFLYDCLNRGLKIYYVPALIAVVKQNESTWFRGFTGDYFTNRGIATRYFMGIPLATLYAAYFAVAKHQLYSKDTAFFRAFKSMLAGIYSPKVVRPY